MATDFWVICTSSESGTYRLHSDVDISHLTNQERTMWIIKFEFESQFFHFFINADCDTILFIIKIVSEDSKLAFKWVALYLRLKNLILTPSYYHHDLNATKMWNYRDPNAILTAHILTMWHWKLISLWFRYVQFSSEWQEGFILYLVVNRTINCIRHIPWVIGWWIL